MQFPMGDETASMKRQQPQTYSTSGRARARSSDHMSLDMIQIPLQLIAIVLRSVCTAQMLASSSLFHNLMRVYHTNVNSIFYGHRASRDVIMVIAVKDIYTDSAARPGTLAADSTTKPHAGFVSFAC